MKVISRSRFEDLPAKDGLSELEWNIYIYIDMYVYIYIYICMYVCMCVYIYIYTYMHDIIIIIGIIKRGDGTVD